MFLKCSSNLIKEKKACPQWSPKSGLPLTNRKLTEGNHNVTTWPRIALNGSSALCQKAEQLERVGVWRPSTRLLLMLRLWGSKVIQVHWILRSCDGQLPLCVGWGWGGRGSLGCLRQALGKNNDCYRNS